MRAFLFSAGLLSVLALPAVGQETFAPTQDLDFEDPEAWAMNFFTSVSLPVGLGPAAELDRGEVDLGLEVLQVPRLDREQRTVGFGGLKEEDLNRSPASGRLRAAVGLGAGWSLEAGWTPPLEVDGVEADLLSLAVEKRLWRGRSTSLGLRLHGQTGEIQGDLTCTEGGDELFPPGSPQNPFGCQEASNDEMSIDSVGLELLVSHDLSRGGASRLPVLHAGVSANRIDTEFQVDALTFGFRDRSLLRSDGDTVSLTAGASWRIGRRGTLGAAVLYSPLEVRRLDGGQLGAPESDDLVHGRLFWSWRIR